ncbi:hypothetical protein QBC43DRAFT_362122 [Cladorrhinum sp. PSN259]|nr:hypothetical protein QBC43DRAFT_362122 [Cladorrhinum sp. PSN259]
MVSVRSFLTSAVAIMAVPAMAAISPQGIIDGLKTLTDQSQKLQRPAQSITIVNAPLIIIGQGPLPVIIQELTQFVETGNAMIQQFEGTQPITNPTDAAAVYNAFHDFARVHTAFLNIMIGKSGILTKVPFVGPPVAAVLRQVESIDDTIAIFLIDNIESKSQDLTTEANSLGQTMDLAIKRYEGLQLGKRESKVFVA